MRDPRAGFKLCAICEYRNPAVAELCYGCGESLAGAKVIQATTLDKDDAADRHLDVAAGERAERLLGFDTQPLVAEPADDDRDGERHRAERADGGGDDGLEKLALGRDQPRDARKRDRGGQSVQ